MIDVLLGCCQKLPHLLYDAKEPSTEAGVDIVCGLLIVGDEDDSFRSIISIVRLMIGKG